MKIKECVEGGAGDCLNINMIENLLPEYKHD
jgi:hypothetical protein